MSEARVTINGVPLTWGQAMALRVAISSFTMDMQSNGCGDDAHGIAMTEAYLARCREIIRLMHK